MKLRRILAVAGKEWREILRDRIFFVLAFLLSPVLMVLFGFGMTQDVSNVSLAILDQDRTAASRELGYRYIGSRYFRFRGYVQDRHEAERLLRSGQVRVVIEIPDQFQQRLAAGTQAEIQTLVDGTFTVTTRTINAYVEAISSAASADLQAPYAARRLGLTLEQARARMEPLKLEIRYLYNQEMRSIWTVAPLLLMVILMWTTPMLMALSVVREKETGSIYNIYASTISRAEFLLGKVLPTAAIAFLNALIMWALAVFYFGTPFKGDPLAFLMGTLLFVVCVCGLGLLVSLAVRTQQAAEMLAVIIGTIIAMSYSGLNIPVDDLDVVARTLARLFPAMYYTNVVEGVFLKSAGFRELASELVTLGVYSVLVLCAAHFFFHKRRPA